MVSSSDILTAFRELANIKQLDKPGLHQLLKDGIQAALQKKYGDNVQAEVEIDEARGNIRIVLLKTVVATVEDISREISIDEARLTDEEFQIGDIMEIPVEFAEFGRSAVQAAKQHIVQRVREGERSRIRDEFSGRVGDLLSGEVQQIERGKLMIMLNKHREAEAIIPYKQQNHREHYHQGEPIRAVLVKVEDSNKGPRLILSRSDPMFVEALFRLEVPEIQQGLVEIKASAREVGSRSKIAVAARDDAIDAVGACVGLKGARVQAVVNELGGERIDIVPWSPDPERFTRMALAPAKVARVYADPASRKVQAVVDEDQLSLAIGRAGQNVRLASNLTGWEIELYSSREWIEKGGEAPLFAPLDENGDNDADVQLNEISGLDVATLAVLAEAGYTTLNDIIDVDREDLLSLPGIAPGEADRIMAIIDELTTFDEDEDGGEDDNSGEDGEE